MKRLLSLMIVGYQRSLSPLLRAVFGPMCRFTPSCSQYALECVQAHGALRGGLLSLKRLSKCHPLHRGGFDPPPPIATAAAALSSPISSDAGPQPKRL